MYRLGKSPLAFLLALIWSSGGQDLGAAEESSGKVSYFAAARLGEVRDKAESVRQVPANQPDGWSISQVNPLDLVSEFKPLQVKRGVVLRAYQFQEGGNGNGVVWALPDAADFPAPDRCVKGRFVPTLQMEVPRPPAAFASVMAQITGDGTPWSYLAASILGRELTEFGALWHGSKWSTHRIVDTNPLQALDQEPADDPDPMFAVRGPLRQWRWGQDRPREWRPSVRMGDDEVVVVFYTFSGWKQQRIFRHTDRFTTGSYDFKSDCTEIAQGPGGFLF
jgi:hypothetical protein